MGAILCWLVVIHSMASYVIRHDRRSQVILEFFLSQANFSRATEINRVGCAKVVGRSLIGRKALQVSRRSVASVSRRLGRGCGSGARVYAD